MKISNLKHFHLILVVLQLPVGRDQVLLAVVEKHVDVVAKLRQVEVDDLSTLDRVGVYVVVGQHLLGADGVVAAQDPLLFTGHVDDFDLQTTNFS